MHSNHARNMLRRYGNLFLAVSGIAAIAAVIAGFAPSTPQAAADGAAPVVRVGYFPNLTHGPALAGVSQGFLQRALDGRATLDVRVVNAGPEAMEALLAGELDLAYVGPSPAINTFLKTEGRVVRIVAGAASGGASLVFRAGVEGSGVGDLARRRVAVPQLGNTQDVSLRRSLRQAGLAPKGKGGDVEVLPVRNPDILALFLRKELDAAWVPEPWATRLLHEAGARRVVDERELWPGGAFTTTVVVARKAFLDARPDLVEAFLRGHRDAVEWLLANPVEGRAAVNSELVRLTGKALPAAVLEESWTRLSFTLDPDPGNLRALADAAREAGYLRGPSADLDALFARDLLDRVLSANGS